jgi:putative Holliday junction resolvase
MPQKKCIFAENIEILGRILAIDYGQKRVGIAVTDPLKIIANGLDTVPAEQIFTFLDNYLKAEPVETIVVGYPVTLRNEASEALVFVNPFLKKLQLRYPNMNVEIYDERFTSKMAFRAMIDGGVKKKDRRDKALIDKVSATILLQSYMESLNYQRL